MACPLKLNEMTDKREYREKLMETMLRERNEISHLTEVEKIRKRKHNLLIDESNDSSAEEITFETFTSNRRVSWISEVLKLDVIPINDDFSNFSTDFMFDVTCIGYYSRSKVMGSLIYFVLDDGTGNILVTYHDAHILETEKEVRRLKNLVQSDNDFSTVEKQQLCAMLHDASVVLEPKRRWKAFNYLIVHGQVSQKKGSNLKFIVASHVSHLDVKSGLKLSNHMALKHQLKQC